MPCAGPPKPSKEEVEKLFESVISFLRKNHKIFIYPPPDLVGFKKSREKVETELKQVLQKVLDQDIQENW